MSLSARECGLQKATNPPVHACFLAVGVCSATTASSRSFFSWFLISCSARISLSHLSPPLCRNQSTVDPDHVDPPPVDPHFRAYVNVSETDHLHYTTPHRLSSPSAFFYYLSLSLLSSFFPLFRIPPFKPIPAMRRNGLAT